MIMECSTGEIYGEILFFRIFIFYNWTYILGLLWIHKKYDEWLRYDNWFIDPEYVERCCAQSVHLYLKPDISLTGPPIQSMSM